MDIYIQKQNTNRFMLTLRESGVINDPHYLFVFENMYNNSFNSVHYSTEDISSSKCRYNLFELVEDVSGSTTGGISVPLSLTPGQYTYKVYEASTVTLDISDTTEIVIETGRLTVDDVSGSRDFENEVIPSQNNNTPSIYD